MKARFLLAAATALTATLALSACGSADDAAAPEAEATDLAAAPEPGIDPALPADNQGFVAAAASSGLYEIEAGKLAQEMSTNQAVEDFGAMMERDHGKADTELKAAAGQVEGVTVPAAMNAKHQADLDALRAAGANFDSVYKTQQLAAHQEALALLQHWSTNGAAGPLKDFATRTAPVVETHLGHAEMLP